MVSVLRAVGEEPIQITSFQHRIVTCLGPVVDRQGDQNTDDNCREFDQRVRPVETAPPGCSDGVSRC